MDEVMDASSSTCDLTAALSKTTKRNSKDRKVQKIKISKQPNLSK